MYNPGTCTVVVPAIHALNALAAMLYKARWRQGGGESVQVFKLNDLLSCQDVVVF